MSIHDPHQPVLLPAIRRAKLDRLDIYEISESELETLERGAPDSLFLNFAIFLLSSAISFLTALLTTNIESPRAFAVFVILTVVGLVGGAMLLALWCWFRQSKIKIFAQIRGRMPPEGVAPDTPIILDGDGYR